MGWSTERNKPCEVKGEDKDTLHHSQTHTAQFQLFFSLKGKTDKSDNLHVFKAVQSFHQLSHNTDMPITPAALKFGLKWAGLNGKT